MQNYLVSAGLDLNSPAAVAHAVAYFKDAAQTWYRQHQQAVELQTANAYNTWAQLKQALLHQFAPVDPQDHARERLFQLGKVEHDDITSYTETFTSTVVDLPNMHEGDRIFHFTHGLPSDVCMHVRMQHPATLSQAMELAAQAGEATHGSSGSFPPTASPTTSPAAATGPTPMELGAMHSRYGSRCFDSGMKCYFCEQPGHSFKHCKELAMLKQQHRQAKQAAGK